MTLMIDELRADLISVSSATNPDNPETLLLPSTQALDELKEGRKSIPATTDARNVALVTKYFDQMVTIANPPKADK